MYAIFGMLALFALMRVDTALQQLSLCRLRGRAHHHASGGRLRHARAEPYHRWFRIGSFFTFQPSELAKPALVLFLAYFLQTRIHAMDDWKERSRALCCPPCLHRPHPEGAGPGHALVCAAVAMAMLYLAGMQVKWIGVGLLASSPVLYYMLWMVPFRRARMEIFFHPELDPLGKGFHITQSLIAVGTGGISGLGLMEGRQKLYFLPEAWTDFIFANISEELGLLGALALVALFCTFGYRGCAPHFIDRPLCALSGLWTHLCGTHPGLLQYQCRHCFGATKGSRCRSSPSAERRSSSPWPEWVCC